MERKYSVSEINAMRSALRTLCEPPPGFGYYEADVDRKVELQLQTHMMNGTDPADLLSAASNRTVIYTHHFRIGEGG
jgi:hypothetical protein